MATGNIIKELREKKGLTQDQLAGGSYAVRNADTYRE